MNFIVIYHNSPQQRAVVLHQLKGMLQNKLALDVQGFRTPFFETQPQWPEDVENVPLHIQIEEFNFHAQKLISVRQLVIDIEEISDSVLTENCP